MTRLNPPDRHPSSSWLLLAIEGELPAREALAVKQHLEHCWLCRADSEQMRQGILDYMHCRDLQVARLEPAPNGWSGFLFRLRKVEDECREAEPVALKQRVVSLWERFSRRSRAAWIAAAISVAVAVVFAFLPLARPPIVSASEVLRLTTQSRQAELTAVRDPEIHQRVLIRDGSRSLTRDLVRHPGRPGRETMPATAEEADVQRIFAENGLNWTDPLSPEGFAIWRDSLVAKEDEVRTVDQQITLTTATSQPGQIRAVSFTVRSADWHPVAERLHLRGERRIEITELTFEVRSTAPDVGIAAAAPLPSPVEHRESAEAELAAAEIEARAALHRIGADMGEQIEIRRDRSPGILVEGLSATAERKRQIEAALSGIPHLATHLLSLSDVAAAPLASNTDVTSGVALPPVLLEQLKREFPDADERQRFVDSTLATSQAILLRAWALRRLAERYPPAGVARLDAASRRTLGSMLTGHFQALGPDLAALRALWASFLRPGAAPAVESEPAAADWQPEVLRLFAAAQAADQLCSWALAGADNSGRDPAELLNSLSVQLAAARNSLDRLSRDAGPDR